MKLSEFAPVLALFGLAAAAAIAQQPSPATPPKPLTASSGVGASDRSRK